MSKGGDFQEWTVCYFLPSPKVGHVKGCSSRVCSSETQEDVIFIMCSLGLALVASAYNYTATFIVWARGSDKQVLMIKQQQWVCTAWTGMAAGKCSWYAAWLQSK